MITIIEGADGTGKSTFAQHLAVANRGAYLHADKPQHDKWGEEYVDPIIDWQAADYDSLVLDRWHVGEMVWPALFGRPSLFASARDFRLCNKAISLLGPVELLIVVRDEDGIRRTLTERGEEDQIDLVLESQRLYLMLADLVTYIPTTIVHSDVLQLPSAVEMFGARRELTHA